MQTKISLKGDKGFLLGYENEAKIGEIEFSLADHLLTIEHTRVPKEMSGKGYAKALTLAIIDYVKKDPSLKIKPVCSYAVDFFKRYPAYNNLLATE